MLNVLAQHDLKALEFFMLFYNILSVVCGVVAIICLRSLLLYTIEKDDKAKRIRQGIFLIDGTIFFRFLVGLFMVKLFGYVYLIVCSFEHPEIPIAYGDLYSYVLYTVLTLFILMLTSKKSNAVFNQLQKEKQQNNSIEE